MYVRSQTDTHSLFLACVPQYIVYRRGATSTEARGVRTAGKKCLIFTSCEPTSSVHESASFLARPRFKRLQGMQERVEILGGLGL